MSLTLRPHPHPTSPSQGEERIGAGLEIAVHHGLLLPLPGGGRVGVSLQTLRSFGGTQ